MVNSWGKKNRKKHREKYRKIVVEREVRCGTLNFIKESKVGEPIILANNPFKKFLPMFRLRSANEVKPN